MSIANMSDDQLYQAIKTIEDNSLYYLSDFDTWLYYCHLYDELDERNLDL